MKRRVFLGIVGGSLVPQSSRAQGVPIVGILRPLPPNAFPETLDAFKKGLGELGYIEGRNLAIENRWSTGRYEQLPQLALELVKQRASVIFTGGGAVSTLAAKAATQEVPIVFVVGDDPIRAGIVTRLNHPEGNVTGITLYAFELERKKLEVLAELAPRVSIIAVLRNPNAPEAEPQANALNTAAVRLGRRLHFHNASTEDEITAAFAALSKLKAGAMLVVNDVFFSIRSDQIIAASREHSIPAIFDFRHHVVAGGLASYGSSLIRAYHQAGIYCGRILKGEKPSDLPVMQPSKFEMVINLKTAKALGLTMPPTLLARADEVIE